MRVYSGGYNDYQYEPRELRRIAKGVALDIPSVLRASGADVVVVSGKSGISMAFAVTMLIDFPLIVVRKPGESSHGNTIEGRNDFDSYIILDDFVDTGATIDRIIHTINNKADSHGYVRPKCVGVYGFRARGEVGTIYNSWETDEDIPYY